MAENSLKTARQAFQQFRCAVTKMTRDPHGEVDCPYCHTRYTKRNGTTHGRKQRWLCLECGRSFGDGQKNIEWYRGVNLGLHFSKTRERLKFAIDLLIMGYSTRQVEAKTGLTHWPVLHARQALKDTGNLPTFCSCGGPSGHKGWCKDRFQRSKRRQAALAKMHERQRRAKL